MNSNAVRDRGFKIVLKDYPQTEVDQLMDYHRANGGWSRYVKFRYFFETIRDEAVTDQDIQFWAGKFSEIMMHALMEPGLLIQETLDFVRKHHEAIPMHIVSGSDQEELRAICRHHSIDRYFISIHGSPKPKKDWVSDLLAKHRYQPESCLLIGDSVNDHEAARAHGLQFMGYRNPEVEALSDMVIDFKN